MGGMRWQLYEEKVFWEVIVPRAPPGHDPVSKKAKKNVDHAKQWDWGKLSEQMASEMERRHPDKKLLRKYDHTLCYEHYFQNYVKRNYSPHAKSFVEAYSASLMRTIDAGGQAANANKTTKTARSTPSKARRQKKTARRLASAQSKEDPSTLAASAEDDEDGLKQGPSPVHPVNNCVAPTRRTFNGPNHDEDDDDSADQKNRRLAYPTHQNDLGNVYPYYGNNQMFYPQPGYSYGAYGPSNPNFDQQSNVSAFQAHQGIPANGFPAYGFSAPSPFGDSYNNHGYSYGHGYSHGFGFGHPQNQSQGHLGVGSMGGGAFHAAMHVGRVNRHDQLAYHQSTGEAANYAPPNYAVGMTPNQGMSDDALGHGHGYDSGPGPRGPSSSIVSTERGTQSQAVNRTLMDPLRLTPVVQGPIDDGVGYGQGPGPVNPSSHRRNAS